MREEQIETIAVQMFAHSLTIDEITGRSQCRCGWSVTPLLSSVHRLHQAEQILAAAYEDAKRRTHAVGLLLADSGDITPVGTRMLDRIWEPAGGGV